MVGDACTAIGSNLPRITTVTLAQNVTAAGIKAPHFHIISHKSKLIPCSSIQLINNPITTAGAMYGSNRESPDISQVGSYHQNGSSRPPSP